MIRARKLPPVSGRTPIMKLELENFARRLQAEMDKKGWTQSDLAREVWGVMTTSAGREAARNRDRISNYVRGLSWPDPRNLAKIAAALGVDPAELAPDVTALSVERAEPDFQITQASGHPDKVHLRVNMLVPFAIAMAIGQMLDPHNIMSVIGKDGVRHLHHQEQFEPAVP